MNILILILIYLIELIWLIPASIIGIIFALISIFIYWSEFNNSVFTRLEWGKQVWLTNLCLPFILLEAYL